MFASNLLALLPVLALVTAAPSPMMSSESSSSNSWSGSGGSSGYGSSSSNYGSGSNSYDSSSGSGNYGSSGSSGYGSGSESSYGSSGSGNGWNGGSSDGSIIEATTIITSSPSYSTPSYGSGSMSGGDLQSCLNTCQSMFGGSGSGSGSMSSGTSTSGSNQSESGSSMSGTVTSSSATTTHTIIVAPTMGVLRFVPLAVTANQGDILEFVWGAGPHTATLSNGNNICNKSTALTGNFDSGKLNATATFQGSVASSNITQFHYCTVATHCQKGMFGMVNPPTTTVNNNLTELATGTLTAPGGGSTAGVGQVIGCSDNSVDCWASHWMNSGSGPMATGTAVKKACGSSGAWSWGGKWDMSSYINEQITKEVIIENIMYSRLMMSMNPSMLTPGAPLPSDWKAAPDLNTFVALAAPNSTSSGVSTINSAASVSTPMAGAESGSASTTSSVGVAGANSSSMSKSGARGIHTKWSTSLVGLLGLLTAQFVL